MAKSALMSLSSSSSLSSSLSSSSPMAKNDFPPGGRELAGDFVVSSDCGDESDVAASAISFGFLNDFFFFFFVLTFYKLSSQIRKQGLIRKVHNSVSRILPP